MNNLTTLIFSFFVFNIIVAWIWKGPRVCKPVEMRTHNVSAHNYFFVIYAPDYSETCGGCAVLHYLADRLNRIYGKVEHFAYVVSYAGNSVIATNPSYETPVLPPWLNASDGIAIYPESIEGNPLNSRHVVRWVLYFPGVNGGPSTSAYSLTEFVACFSQGFCQEFVSKNRPVFDLRIVDYGFHYYQNLPKNPRESTVVLKKKSTFFSGNKVLHRQNTPDIRGIRLDPTTSKRKRVEIFATTKYFYSYDAATFISLEAAMAGCLSIVIPFENVTKKEWLQTMTDDAKYGIAYGEDDIGYANATLPLVLPFLREKANIQLEQVREFVNQVRQFYSIL